MKTAEEKLADVLDVLDCGQLREPGCCGSCDGTGVAGYELCWDCRGTGHCHGPVEADDLAAYLDCLRRAAMGETE